MKSLDHVSIKTIPYISKSGVIVEIPGPWTLRLSGVSTPDHATEIIDSDEAADEPADDDDDEDEDIEHQEDFQHLLSQVDREKFVVRNEFGHVRLQPLLEVMESLKYGTVSDHFPPLEIGGHCVLSEPDFQACLQKKWGIPHPLAGRFHPIAGTMIPESTLLFYIPRSEGELEIIWQIVHASYTWALSAQK